MCQRRAGRAGAALPGAPREQAPGGSCWGGRRSYGGAGGPCYGPCAPAAGAAGALGPATAQVAVSQKLESDVCCGAQGAFVAEKTPKMLLADWCQQQKRPKPRIRVNANPAAPGSFIAKARPSGHRCSAQRHLAGVHVHSVMKYWETACAR